MTASCNTITISIHALRKESDNDGIGGAFASPISIHALRKESDLTTTAFCVVALTFQSTLSVRRATLTHVSVTPIYQYFNPRSP